MSKPTKALIAWLSLLSAGGFAATVAVADDSIHVPSALVTIVERIEISAAEEGILASLKLKEGDLVAAGQLLGAVDSRSAALQQDQVLQDLQMARELAKNDVRVRLAQKEHQLSKVELERAHKVNEGFANSVSAKEIDRLKLSVERTQLEIEFAHFEQSQHSRKAQRMEADLKLAQHQLELRKILAPIAGMVVHIERRQGEWVNRGDLVARLVRVDRLRAEGFVEAQQAILGLVGRTARIEVPLAGQETVAVTGRVVFVSPEVQPVNSQVRFWAEFENDGLRLRPGLTASITIEPKAERDKSSAQLESKALRP